MKNAIIGFVLGVLTVCFLVASTPTKTYQLIYKHTGEEEPFWYLALTILTIFVMVAFLAFLIYVLLEGIPAAIRGIVKWWRVN